MRCPSCQSENPASAKFCSECGARLERRCPSCGADVGSAAKFCPDCGAPLAFGTITPTPASLQSQFADLQRAMPASLRDKLLTQPEGENRVLTILFADLTASVSTTAGLRPEEGAALVNDVLRAMVDAVLRYDGRINRLLGDGMLAFFGTPQAHENDPERAILAALAIREEVQRLGRSVTAGINVGEVYLGGVGSDQYQEIAVMGPVVNLAARLRDKAQPGEILVGEAVFRQVHRAFEVAACPPLQVKGFAEPVTAYRVVRALPHPEKVRGIEGLRARLIGREDELGHMKDCLAEFLRGRGQVVSIIGEPGVGKSRLVAELKEIALAGPGASGGESPQPLWLEGRCVDVGMAVTYWPFLDILRQHFGWQPEDDERSRGERIVSGLRTLASQSGLAPGRVEEMVPLLAQALSVEFGDERDERLRHASPEQIRAQTFLAFRDFFLALARHQPVVVVLEDLHWGDSLSLDLISLLMEALTLAPLLLICVYRPEREHKCWHIGAIATRKCPERYTEINVRELTPEQSQRLVQSLLRIEALPTSVRDLILEKAQGNPFFVEEVVRSLIESGLVYEENGAWRAREGIEELAVPETIQSVVLGRVDRLEEDVRHVLQSAAVIGRLFRRRLLALVTEKDAALDQALGELEDRALIYEERAIPEEEYSFQHALTQETVYANLLRRRRVTFHRQVAEAMERLYRDNLDEYYEQLAYHYGRSGVADKAVEYLLKAGQKAAARNASVVALGCYRQALEFARGGDQYDVVLAERAKLLVSLFRGEEAARDYERLLESARREGDRARELEALLGLSGACYVVALDDVGGGYALRSREHSELAYRLARELDDRRGMARALFGSLRLSGFLPEYQEQIKANAREARALAEELGEEDLVIESKLALVPDLRRPEAVAELEGLVTLLTARGDLARLNSVYFRLAWMHYSLGSFRRSVECCDVATQVAGQLGVAPVQYPTIRGLALLCLGRYGEAWQAVQAEIADVEHPFGAAFQRFGVGVCYLELAAYERAARVLEEVVEHAIQLRRDWLEQAARVFRAEALAKAVPPEEADLAGLGGDSPLWVGRLAAARAETRLVQGKPEAALVEAEAAAVVAEREGARPWQVFGQEVRARALLALGRPAEAAEVAGEALRRAEEMGYLSMVWRLRATRGRALLELGEVDSGTRELRAAADLVRQLAGTIEDAELLSSYLADGAVASVLAEV